MVIDAAASITGLDMVRAEDACHALNLRLVELFHDVRLLHHTDRGGRASSARSGGSGMINGDSRLQLGQVHLPVQHDPIAGGFGVGRD